MLLQCESYHITSQKLSYYVVRVGKIRLILPTRTIFFTNFSILRVIFLLPFLYFAS